MIINFDFLHFHKLFIYLYNFILYSSCNVVYTKLKFLKDSVTNEQINIF